jgi:hypothetical protein
VKKNDFLGVGDKEVKKEIGILFSIQPGQTTLKPHGFLKPYFHGIQYSVTVTHPQLQLAPSS